MEVAFSPKFKFLFEPARYKVAYGGRGGAKSWAFARVLLVLALRKRLRILNVREFQTSIADSVHKLLGEQITALGLDKYYDVQKTKIKCVNGSEFIFKGIRTNAQEIKSLEGVDVCWVEEAQAVSESSWELLIPTIRKENSEIWITFNPMDEDDATYKRFVLTPPPEARVVKVSWQDNPWLPETLRKEKDYCLAHDPDAYDWIWEGNCRRVSDAQVFKGKYVIEEFDTPADARFFHGVDWGFSQDPTALLRVFIKDDELYIDMEAYGVGVELDDIAKFFDFIPTSRLWPIKADNSRPETISHVRRKGFNITGAKKWSGSVEDGLSLLKGFRRIIIHPRCKHTAAEFRLYSYKVDKTNGDVLPVLLDANNHCVDALRYALDGYIKGRGTMNISQKALRVSGYKKRGQGFFKRFYEYKFIKSGY